jgi:cation diffusion facilitator CzcD-associated flavoprotein CzcO
METRTKDDRRIAIIGAGPGGLCMAIRLREAGFENFVILEKADGVGGTWRHNRYPGCSCDIPSHLYSYSFEIKPDWSRPYASQPEILAYLEGCADKYDVRRFCRFGCEVRRATWDEARATWSLETAKGERIEADIVVSAIGMFNELNFPDIPGLPSFAGTSFHSARWPADLDLTGRRIGVIGSAASAIQFVPEIVKEAAQVDYYQRTANWILPKEDDPYSEEELENRRRNPEIARAIRDEIYDRINSGGPKIFDFIQADMEAAGRQNIALVEDPDVRARLVPTHPWGCKRPLFSSEYYQAFNRPNLELVTEGIDHIEGDGIVTVDGRKRVVDTLVLATGFKTTQYLSAIDVRGRGGLSIEDAWSDGAQAYKGVTTSGFPNLFMLYGPNTNSDSLITMIEYHVEHALLHIRRMVDEGYDWVDVRPEPMADYNEEIQREIEGIGVWQAGCTDYYRAPSGRVVTQWPRTMGEHRSLLGELRPGDYEVGRRSDPPV